MLKNVMASSAAFAIVKAPLTAVTSTSLDVPLCAFAVGATAVPKAVSITPLSTVEPPANDHETVPEFVPDTVKKTLKVTVPAFHD